MVITDQDQQQTGSPNFPERENSDKEIQSAGTSNHDLSDHDEKYPHGIKLVLLLLSVYLSIFLVALDRTIIATALPEITDHFQSFGDIGWVSSL
jgi:hypothetical protein